MRVALLVPAGFFAGAGLCRWLMRFAPPDIAVDRAQPLAVVTYWQHFGALMWIALATAIAIAAIGYFCALRAAPTMRAVLACSVLACAAALLFPVVFSSDVYAYAGYGDMALHGISPYAHARVTVRDPLLDAMLWQWGNPPPMCVYGPAFVALTQGIVAMFAPLGPAAPLWALRAFACLALVACAPLAYAAFAPLGRATRLTAAAGIALNPIAIWSAAEGHNDSIALAIALGGFALAARNRIFAGALVAALAALIKAPGAVAAIALAARSRAAAAGAALGLAIVAGFAIPLEYGVRTQFAQQARYFPQFSLQYVSPGFAVAVVLALLACSAFRYFTAPAHERERNSALAYLVFAAWLAIPNPYPWYALWVLPVAFLAWRALASWALIALSLLMVLRYYPDATTDLSRPLSLAIAALQFAIPLALLIAHMVSARQGRREIRTAAPGFATPRTP